MDVCFVAEEGNPVVTVSKQALTHLSGLLGEAAVGDSVVQCHSTALKPVTLQRLCGLIDALPIDIATLAHSLALHTMGDMLGAHALLQFSPLLRDLLCDCLMTALQTHSNESLAEMCAPDSDEDDGEWFLTPEQRRITDRVYLHRLRLLFGVAAQLLQDRCLAAHCLTRVALPRSPCEVFSETLGLSVYMTRAIYDLVVTHAQPQILYIVCTNADIEVVNAALYVGTERARMTPAALLKSLLNEAHRELKRAPPAEKDAAMVRRFLGWAETERGHFHYVYYSGPSSRTADDLGQLHNWSLVPVNLLRFFHTRLDKEQHLLWHLSLTDLTETDDGHHNAALDVRYVAHRWANRASNGANLARITTEYGGVTRASPSLLAQLGQ